MRKAFNENELQSGHRSTKIKSNYALKEYPRCKCFHPNYWLSGNDS